MWKVQRRGAIQYKLLTQPNEVTQTNDSFAILGNAAEEW
jgi:hypothetical protein